MRPALILGCVLVGAAATFLSLHREAPRTPSLASATTPAVKAATVSAQTAAHDPRPARDPASKLTHLMQTGDVVGLQKTARSWFEADPAAMREWLDAQPSFARLQPVLIQIAQDISASGQPAEALKWAELLDEGPDRDHTLFEIYAMGRRHGSFSDAELRASPFTPRQIDDLLSGAADD
ncbi:hypothetical protein [Luteolibacter sp. LG18]|uniref:hypothetical protein n=1 Tax=Luteolibacter sp. LG18 TaxID=2819286 RepID=UPI002B2CB505|nr:hypothetical protein llg_22530 [Luteolibacter sp. LG18]